MTAPLTSARYDPVAITLHWLIAVSIILMIPLGLFMEDFPISIKFTAYNLHKSIGLSVLGLSVFRLIWRLMNPPPALPAGMSRIERLLAQSAHWGLYFLMIAMPLTGWLMVSASAKYPTVFFGLGEVPFIPMPTGIDTKAAGELFYESHEWLAYGAIGLILAHLAAALKHHFIHRDDVLRRMLPQWRKK